MMKRIICLLMMVGMFWVLVGCSGDVADEVVEETTAVSPPTATTPPEPEPTELATAVATPTPNPLYVGTNDYPWWNDTVFYQIYVRSFKDSDGDGIGDINGIIEMLDYLNDGDPTTTNDLGITGIWLMPIMEAPKVHPHGYHVEDYYQVETDYGTNEDFQRLVAEAHERGIRVIIDLVLNHSAQEHEWFQASQDPDSEFRDWYVWADENPGYRGPNGQQVWHRNGDSFYYGIFNGLIPDFNLENPAVTAELYNIIRFWMEEMQIDGFRLDAIKHLIENGEFQENSTASHEWLQDFHNYYTSINPDAVSVGEAWTATREILKYTGNEVDIAFEFDLATAILSASRNRAARPIATKMEDVVDDYPAGQYATFLANHDQNRTLSQLDGNEVKAQLAATILLTSPGVPFIYYGDEIGLQGMRDTSAAISESPMRRPMTWASDSIGVGFTDGVPWRAPADDYDVRSVALQTDDPDSLLNHYRALIQLRNKYDALRVGEWALVKTNSAKVYAFLRYVDDEIILVLINLHNEPVSSDEYSLELDEGPLSGGQSATLIFGDGAATSPDVNDSGGFSAYTPFELIPGQTDYIIQLTP
ncbi:MAG: alpha-amylase [Chloroflexi bacterium]|nr:alpha-amylase [Chloroflexota bacterium]